MVDIPSTKDIKFFEILQEQATTTGTVNPEWPGFQVELLLSMLCQQYHAASFVVTPYFIADSYHIWAIIDFYFI